MERHEKRRIPWKNGTGAGTVKQCWSPSWWTARIFRNSKNRWRNCLEETNQLLGKISQYHAIARDLEEQSGRLHALRDTLPALEQEEKQAAEGVAQKAILEEQLQKQKTLLDQLRIIQELTKSIKTNRTKETTAGSNLFRW